MKLHISIYCSIVEYCIPCIGINIDIHHDFACFTYLDYIQWLALHRQAAKNKVKTYAHEEILLDDF